MVFPWGVMVLHVGGPRAAFSRVILLCRFQR